MSGQRELAARVGARLDALDGVGAVTLVGLLRQGEAQVGAEVSADAADDVLSALADLGVPAGAYTLSRLEIVRPQSRDRPVAGLLGVDLAGQAGRNARPIGRYLVFMAVAGVIAAFGVINANQVLIVGAMAVSPDLLPVTAICTGLASRDLRLATRALVTLVVGLSVTGATAAGVVVLLDALDLLPSGYVLSDGALLGLTSVGAATIGVALAAGVAGMLALETRSSAAVGVAISVTTIPAAAYLGVAAGLGELNTAGGTLDVLVVNIVSLVVGGTALLAAQGGLRAERAG